MISGFGATLNFLVETRYYERPFFGERQMLKFPVLSFFGAAALFFTATLTAGIYGFSASKLNLWLALGLTLALNPLGLNGKRTAAWGLCAGIAAAGAFALPAQIWSVWIFAAFLAAGGLLKRLYGNDGMPNNEAKNGNSGNEKATEYGRLIILAAAYFNLSFITNTGHTDVQYDFASCFNYIEYILENNFLFWQENPLLTRPSYSTYHPILHFLLAAGEMRLATVLETGMLNAELPAMGAGANMQLAAEATQVCFCFYMLWYYFLAGKILRFFRLSRAAYLGGLAFICFFPAYNAIAGFFNNDCLLLPLQAGTVYYSLLYYRDGGRKNLARILLFATAAALTKLSGIIVLPLTGAAIALRLWQQRKKPENGRRLTQTKNKPQKNDTEDKRLLTIHKQLKSGAENKRQLAETAVFGILLVAGLSIWPLYQHYFLNVGFDFVPPQEHLSLKSYGLWQRFNPLGALFYPQMFYNDFGINLWETMTKTALFGQWDFSMRGADIMGLITALVLIYKALLVLAVVAAAYLGVKKRQTQAFWLTMILLAGIIAGQIMFGLKHPYMCNQDFRYVAIITLPVALLLAQFFDKLSNAGRRTEKTFACGAGLALIAAFAFLSAFVWWRISF